MGRVSRLLKHSWVHSWLGCSGSWKRTPINLCRCDNTLFRRGTNQESIECSAYLRSMTACANKRCSIGWNPSSSQYSMMLASDIGEGDRQRMHCARSGKRSKVGRSGSWMRTSETFWIYLHTAPLFMMNVETGRVECLLLRFASLYAVHAEHERLRVRRDLHAAIRF